jgi:hypothetical protein
MKRIAAAIVVAILTSFPAAAWNHTGHKVVAELAWRNMSSGERKAASELLKQHPHYALLLATNVPAGIDTNEWAFLNAAVWPDMVRPARRGDPEKPESITKYHRSPWHYINIPWVLPSDADQIKVSSFTIPATNVLWALSNVMAELADPKLSGPERAVSLCWVSHLVGDLHQPLHAATLLSKAFPRGDMGGNSLAVVDTSQQPLNLHSFWDGILGDGDTYEAIAILTDCIANASQYQPRTLPEYRRNNTVGSWVEESFLAAGAFAYDEGHLKFADWRDSQSGAIPGADIPRLRSTYITNANEVSRRRISLAGQRLADVLEKAL